MTDPLTEELDSNLTEAIGLRFQGELPTFDADPAELVAALQDIRRRLDRVEELVARGLRLKGRADRLRALTTAQAEDAWDKKIDELRGTRRGPVSRDRDEYSSAKERYAEANLATLDLRAAARQANDTANQVSSHVELLKHLQRGLDGTRHDINTALRTLAFESTLDR